MDSDCVAAGCSNALSCRRAIPPILTGGAQAMAMLQASVAFLEANNPPN
jgi:hypothetical protein